MKPIISPTIRIRHPEDFIVGEDSIVDDFCYFSTKVRIGRCTHIVSGCTVGGGGDMLFRIGDFSGLGSGSRVWCTSDDIVNDLVALPPPDVEPVKQHLIRGDVIMDDYTAVGSNSVIMPRNHIPIGTVIGALSFVPTAFRFRPWSVYAGIPIRSFGLEIGKACSRRSASARSRSHAGRIQRGNPRRKRQRSSRI